MKHPIDSILLEIPILKPDYNQALRYMGYHKQLRDNTVLHTLQEAADKLLPSLSPKVLYQSFSLKNSPIELVGKDIQNHLNGCDDIILFCATIGQGADRAIRIAMLSDIFYGMAMDALASALVEQVCDSAEKEIISQLKDVYPTWRFSPGYGDFPLSLQEQFVTVLKAQKKIGLTVSLDHLLIPTKSVTAIIGISQKPLPKYISSCEKCKAKENCIIRKNGGHCGLNES